MKNNVIQVLIIILSGITLPSLLAHGSRDRDDAVYNQIVRLAGHVETLNHPRLGRTPAGGTYIVFQREDCKKALVATRTDMHGDYELFVGRGRYKIIITDARGGGAPSHDLLAPDQPRFVDASSWLPEGTRFDVKLVIPKE